MAVAIGIIMLVDCWLKFTCPVPNVYLPKIPYFPFLTFRTLRAFRIAT